MRATAIHLCLGGLVALTASTASANTYFAQTDRVGYTGQVTTYTTLADAQAGTNAIATYAIPNRNADAPSDTAYRDAGFYMANDFEGSSANLLLTAWYYTTEAGDHWSGHGNPNNTNTGFVQLYDGDGNTDSLTEGTFGDFDGTHYTTFHLRVEGANAGSADGARLWPAPKSGAAAISAGTFISYDLDATFAGLEGVLDSNTNTIESNNHPMSVSGGFTGIFQNTGTDTDVNGFYVFDFTFGMDNWAYAQDQSGALNGDLAPSQFVEVVPEPASLALLSAGGLLMLKRRRSA